MSLSVRQRHTVCVETPGGCKDTIQGRCVQYSGALIPVFNIQAGDTMDLSLQKITQYIINAGIGGYTDAQAIAAVGAVLNPAEFSFNPAAPSISINQIDWSKVVNAPQFLTSYQESDPTVPQHVKNILASQIATWNLAYSWGNHAEAGYLKSYTETDPIFTAHVAASITAQQVANWTTAYQKRPTALQVTGTADKRVLLTLGDGTTLQSNLFSFPNNGNNYPTALSFESGVLTLSREGLAPLTVSLDGRYLQSFTEVDPTVPSWVKAIPQGTAAQPYLKWSTGAWRASGISWNDLQDKPVLPTLYTDEMAQDAIAAAWVDSDSIYFVYDDAQNLMGAMVVDQYIIDLINVHVPPPMADNGLHIDGLTGEVHLGGTMRRNTTINIPDQNSTLAIAGPGGNYWKFTERNIYFELVGPSQKYVSGYGYYTPRTRVTQYNTGASLFVTAETADPVPVTSSHASVGVDTNGARTGPRAYMEYHDERRTFSTTQFVADANGLRMEINLSATGANFKGLYLDMDGNIRLNNFLNSRAVAGTATKFLGTDASGYLGYYSVDLGNAGQNGGNFIWNQYGAAQTADFWINGRGRIDRLGATDTTHGLYLMHYNPAGYGTRLSVDDQTGGLLISGLNNGTWTNNIISVIGGRVEFRGTSAAGYFGFTNYGRASFTGTSERYALSLGRSDMADRFWLGVSSGTLDFAKDNTTTMVTMGGTYTLDVNGNTHVKGTFFVTEPETAYGAFAEFNNFAYRARVGAGYNNGPMGIEVYRAINAYVSNTMSAVTPNQSVKYMMDTYADGFWGAHNWYVLSSVVARLHSRNGVVQFGINTDDPQYTLDVNGQTRIRYTAANTAQAAPALLIENPTGGTQSAVRFSFAGVTKGSWRTDSDGNVVVSGAGNMYMGYNEFSSTSNIYFGSWNGTANGMTYDGTNRRFGIGINAPQYTLDVNGTGRFVASADNRWVIRFDVSNTGNYIRADRPFYGWHLGGDTSFELGVAGNLRLKNNNNLTWLDLNPDDSTGNIRIRGAFGADNGFLFKVVSGTDTDAFGVRGDRALFAYGLAGTDAPVFVDATGKLYRGSIMGGISAQNGLNTTYGPVELGGGLLRRTHIANNANGYGQGGTTTDLLISSQYQTWNEVAMLFRSGGVGQIAVGPFNNTSSGPNGTPVFTVEAYAHQGLTNAVHGDGGNGNVGLLAVVKNQNYTLNSFAGKFVYDLNIVSGVGAGSNAALRAEMNMYGDGSNHTGIALYAKAATTSTGSGNSPYAIYSDGGLNYFLDVPNATVDPDKIMVWDGGLMKYMTKAQLGIGGSVSLPATRIAVGDSNNQLSYSHLTFDGNMFMLSNGVNKNIRFYSSAAGGSYHFATTAADFAIISEASQPMTLAVHNGAALRMSDGGGIQFWGGYTATPHMLLRSDGRLLLGTTGLLGSETMRLGGPLVIGDDWAYRTGHDLLLGSGGISLTKGIPTYTTIRSGEIIVSGTSTTPFVDYSAAINANVPLFKVNVGSVNYIYDTTSGTNQQNYEMGGFRTVITRTSEVAYGDTYGFKTIVDHRGGSAYGLYLDVYNSNNADGTPSTGPSWAVWANRGKWYIGDLYVNDGVDYMMAVNNGVVKRMAIPSGGGASYWTAQNTNNITNSNTGSVIIGQAANIDDNEKLKVVGPSVLFTTGNVTSRLVWGSHWYTQNAPALLVGADAAGAVGGHLILSNSAQSAGDMGQISFESGRGLYRGQIKFVQSENGGNYGGSIQFFTGGGSVATTYAAQFTHDQKLLVGYTASQGSYVGQFNGNVFVGGNEARIDFHNAGGNYISSWLSNDLVLNAQNGVLGFRTGGTNRWLMNGTGQLYTSGTDPLSYKLAVTGGIWTNTIKIDVPATPQWAEALQMHSELSAGQYVSYALGKNSDQYNRALFWYYHAGDSSVNNTIAFGFSGSTQSWSMSADGKVSISSLNNANDGVDYYIGVNNGVMKRMPTPGGGTPSLTSTYVGVGNASNQLSGSAELTYSAGYMNLLTTNSYMGYKVGHSSGNAYVAMQWDSSNSQGLIQTWNRAHPIMIDGYSLRFDTANVTRMQVLNSGKVLIGKDDDRTHLVQIGGDVFIGTNKMLEVNGRIYAHNTLTPTSSGYQVGMFAGQYTYNAQAQANGSVWSSNMVQLENRLNASMSLSTSAIHSANFILLRLLSDTASTISVSQSGLRAMSANGIQIHLPQTSVTTSINHLAGMQVYGLYQDTGTTDCVAVGNYYALLLGRTREHLSLPSKVTSAYAIYQEGDDDMNYWGGDHYLNKLKNNTSDQWLGIASDGKLKVMTAPSGGGGAYEYTPSCQEDSSGNTGDITYGSGTAFIKTSSGWFQLSLTSMGSCM